MGYGRNNVIGLLVGSQSGNADIVADAVEDRLAATGSLVRRVDLAAPPHALRDFGALLAVCSTYGTGEIPQRLAGFAEQIPGVDLHGMPIGVIALGDRLYLETFCGGGRQLAKLLRDAGANLTSPILTLDAGEHPEPEGAALAWLDGWVATLTQRVDSD